MLEHFREQATTCSKIVEHDIVEYAALYQREAVIASR
jgi:hypothetical protein